MSGANVDDADGVLDLRVEQMRREAAGVLSVDLADPGGGLLPAWQPGAHIDLGTAMALRQYSLCGDPADRTRYRVAVLDEPASRGGSSYVHRLLRVGDLVEVGGPRNHFALAPAERYLFVAGGIGITPLLPMIEQAAAARLPWRLVYLGRDRATMAFLDRLDRHGDAVTVVHGRDNLTLGAPEPGTAVYCCGPAGLLDTITELSAGWPETTLHVERFTARAVDTADDRPFEVTCARSQVTVKVDVGATIIDGLEQAGVGVANACRTGVCGSCETPVLAGVPEHRDTVLDPGDLTRVMVCVSRASTDRLVLDI